MENDHLVGGAGSKEGHARPRLKRLPSLRPMLSSVAKARVSMSQQNKGVFKQKKVNIVMVLWTCWRLKQLVPGQHGPLQWRQRKGRRLSRPC
jgi:hypothetical protein